MKTAKDGKKDRMKYYNLDVIISVGYRVKSIQGTQFRIWDTKTLREFIIKGFVLDDERLKNGVNFGKHYFDELLERIREIRASERSELNRFVNMYLDYAELQASKQIPMKMQDWANKLDGFLNFNEYKILKDFGTVISKVAKELAEGEYEKFRIDQDKNYESDFDKKIKKYFNGN